MARGYGPHWRVPKKEGEEMWVSDAIQKGEPHKTGGASLDCLGLAAYAFASENTLSFLVIFSGDRG